MSGTEAVDLSLRMAAALDYLRGGNDEDMREHYIWLVKQMMAKMAPEDLSTSALVATVVAWTPDHSRVIIGKPVGGDSATVLQLVPSDAACSSALSGP